MSIEVRCGGCRKWATWKGDKAVCVCGKVTPPTGRHEFSLRVRVERGGKKSQKRVALGWMTIGEVLRYQRDIRAAKLSGDKNPINEPVTEVTWHQAMLRYLDKLQAENANRMYWNDTRRYLTRMLEVWGDVPLTKITPRMIEDFRVRLLQESGLSKASCDRHHAAGKACWRYSGHGLRDNPFTEVRLYRPKNDRISYLNPEQAQALLSEARKASRPLFEILMVALSTGLRKGNILRLRRDEVDFTARVINVIQKGGTPHTVPLSTTLAEILRAIPDNGTEYFWINPSTGEPYRTDRRKEWQKIKSMARIPEDFRFHDLRHTVATMILSRNGNLRTVQEVLGHSDFAVTTKYAHVLPDHLVDIIDQITPDPNGSGQEND